MCSFHSRSAYYSHTVHAPCWKGKKKSSRLPKATGLFYQKFSQSNSNAGNSALTWTFGMTKKSPNILTKFVLSLRYRESSLTPNTYPHSLSLIQVTTGDVLAHLQGSNEHENCKQFGSQANHNFLVSPLLVRKHKARTFLELRYDSLPKLQLRSCSPKKKLPPLPDSVKKAGLPEHGVAHTPEVSPLERAADALQHRGRLPGHAVAAARGRARHHLVRGQHGGVPTEELLVVVVPVARPTVEFVPFAPATPRWGNGDLDGGRLVVRRRGRQLWVPGPRRHRDGARGGWRGPRRRR